MNKNINANDFIGLANMAFSAVPKLMVIAWFVACIALIVTVFKSRGKGLGVMEAAAIAIALGLGMK